MTKARQFEKPPGFFCALSTLNIQVYLSGRPYLRRPEFTEDSSQNPSAPVAQLFDTDDLDEEKSNASGTFIGLDEAGYGPNLGPLVIASTCWSTPGQPSRFDFYQALNSVVDPCSTCRGERLHIADSKRVNVGKNGFQSLELSAISLLQAAGIETTSLLTLLSSLTQQEKLKLSLSKVPWFQTDLHLPVLAENESLTLVADKFKKTLSSAQLACDQIAVQFVTATDFNADLERYDSKGVLLSNRSMQLLSQVWSPENMVPTLIVGDKHGGRNRYAELLETISAPRAVKVIEEGRAKSCYQVRSTEIRFQTKGEEHFPVAAASIIAKYLRELAMIQFNRFWQQHMPDLKPTKGYPVDAKRYWQEIKSVQRSLGVSDELLWRRR